MHLVSFVHFSPQSSWHNGRNSGSHRENIYWSGHIQPTGLYYIMQKLTTLISLSLIYLHYLFIFTFGNTLKQET